jgi:hypothetical protein
MFAWISVSLHNLYVELEQHFFEKNTGKKGGKKLIPCTSLHVAYFLWLQ